MIAILISTLEIFSERGTTDKAVLESLHCFGLLQLKMSAAKVLVGCTEGVRSTAIS